jgi:hypothetical protein
MEDEISFDNQKYIGGIRAAQEGKRCAVVRLWYGARVGGPKTLKKLHF